MNPLLMTSILRGMNKRTCLKCKRDQVVSALKKRKTVSCKFCGADIPPAKKH